MTPVTLEFLRGTPLPDHAGAGSKEARGAVLVVGGSVEVPGAALLAAVAALRAGAGKLQMATCRSVAVMTGLMVPEALVLGLAETEAGGIEPDEAARLVIAAERVRGLVIGPGMMDPEATRALVASVLEGVEGVPIVLDAGALDGLQARPELLRRHAGRVILTPHTGEMAHLLGVERDAVEADKLAHARDVARRFGCVVVMKGAATEIVSPDGEAWQYTGGTIGLATSGSGDTLAGVIGGLLARGAAPVWAAIWGVFLHGEAGSALIGRHGGIGFLARELLDEIPRVMSRASDAEGDGLRALQ